ncbi:hypothetical protein CFP56_027312 [Quercus suber]|uniref:Uncharacterized protein n=1 Tax=Quercus suber TaxID=58331 RepID=A0AAW0LY30_QUESU
MPQESYTNPMLTSPCKNLRGLKALIANNEASYTEEIINDHELAHRKAEEAETSKNIVVSENKRP